MKNWGQKFGLGVALTLLFSLSACSYMEYTGMQGAQSQPVNYAEKNGKIDIDSICADQRDDKKAYYNCAAHADKWLDQECNNYRDLYTSSDTSTAQRYRHEYYKFCDAAAAWETPSR